MECLYSLCAVVCVPECQHGAPCVDVDVCNCPAHYTGDRCEIGKNGDGGVVGRMRVEGPLMMKTKCVKGGFQYLGMLAT